MSSSLNKDIIFIITFHLRPIYIFPENPTASPSTTAVIVVAYMRSGSSLTGDILQQSPGAFYVYEPLHYTKFTLQQLWEIFVNGTIRWECIYLIHSWLEPPHDKTSKMTCAPCEDSNQPGHPPSLIRIFGVRMKKHWVLSYPWSASNEALAWRTCHVIGLLCYGSLCHELHRRGGGG